MKLNQEEIKTILPHRDPMLLVTSVEELTPGVEIRASFYADPAREIFPGTQLGRDGKTAELKFEDEE